MGKKIREDFSAGSVNTALLGSNDLRIASSYWRGLVPSRQWQMTQSRKGTKRAETAIQTNFEAFGKNE